MHAELGNMVTTGHGVVLTLEIEGTAVLALYYMLAMSLHRTCTKRLFFVRLWLAWLPPLGLANSG